MTTGQGFIRDLDELRSKRAKIEELAQRHGITNIRAFGSVARGDAGPGSDLDLLVDLHSGSSLFELVAFERELSEVLGLKVQVFTEGALHRMFRDRVMAEAVAV